jgi:ATP-dependent helicase/nuclease subunit B
MTGVCLVTGSRRALEQRLADEVVAARARDPLAPLPVLVGGTLLRPYLRRRIAEITGGHLNVRFITVGELGLRLGQSNLIAAGRRPLPFLADRILAHQVALDAEGYFQPVGAMPGFPSVLLRTLRDLRTAGVSAATFAEAVASEPDPTTKLAALAELYADHEQRRAGFYSSEDGLIAADADALGADQLLVYGVWQPTPLLLQALGLLAKRVRITLMLPPGDDPVTHELTAWADAHEATRTALDEPGEQPQPHLVSAPDPTREVAETVRACLRWADSGIPFHEMAVVYRHSEPYRPLLEAAFREAGIPVYLHEGTPLTERPLGRRIAALLDLVDGDLERATVMTFLADARLPSETWERYGKVSAAGWDTDSRRASVVRGADQWQQRLSGYRAELAARYAEDPPSWLRERLDRVDALQAFVADLDGQLKSRHERASWQDHLAWLRALLTTYVADAKDIVDALDGLAALDSLSDALPFERFREAVVAALEGLRAADVLGGGGAFGVRGVALLDANTVRHLGFTAVAVVGIAERRWPPPPRQDALLLDDEREALNAKHGWSLPLRAHGADPEPLQFALITAAADRELQLSVPRTQDGETRPVLASTFLLDAASQRAGRPVRVGEFERVASELGRRVPAGRLTATDAREALTELGYLRSLLEDGTPLGVELLRRRMPRYDRVKHAEDAHWAAIYGPHDGVLSAAGAQHLDGHRAFARPFSPTSLEAYAKCPQKWFLGRVLGIKRDEEPEELLRISAMDRGSVFHAIVERFMRELPVRPPKPSDRESLAVIAEAELDRARADGLTGHPVLWAGDRAAIREDIERWFEHELADERAHDFDQADYEVRFGPNPYGGADGPLASDEPLRIELPGGSAIEVTGRADRIDYRAVPAAFRVIDYKTGKSWGKENALDGGMALQLPIYLLAAAKALGLTPDVGEAQYFYATRKGEFKRVRFTGDGLASRREDLDRVLTELDTGMRGGDFHAEPSDRNCGFCEFDSVCDKRRERFRKRKAADPHAVRVDARKQDIA